VMTRAMARVCFAVGTLLLLVTLVPIWLYFRLKWRPARLQPITVVQKGQS
jgi:hypothetical protein